MWLLLKRFACDDAAQEVVEYALLTAAIGLAGAASWPLIVQALGTTYQGLDKNTQDLWESPNPQ